MVIAVLLSTVDKAFCEATTVQQSRTVVQGAVAIEKTVTPGGGSINPNLEGEATVLTSSFRLQSNNEATFFVVYSTIQTDTGNVSAFDGAGNLLFGNTTILPAVADVNSAKSGTAGNANVIAYPFLLSGENVTTATAESDKVTLVDPLVDGILNQRVGGTPAPNTFSTIDEAGIYKATVYVSAVTEL